eukprot:gene22181-29243_t
MIAHPHVPPTSPVPPAGPAGPAPKEKKRICWTDAMHDSFMKVVAELKASRDERVIPTNIARRMKDSYDLSTSQIKSQLQKYTHGKYGPVGSRSTPVSVSTGQTSPTPSLFATFALPRQASAPLPASHPHTSKLGSSLPHAGLGPNAPALYTCCKPLCKRASGSASLPIMSHPSEEGRGCKHGTLSLRNPVVMIPVALRVFYDGAPPSSPGVGSVSHATTGTVTPHGPLRRAGGVLGDGVVVDGHLNGVTPHFSQALASPTVAEWGLSYTHIYHPATATTTSGAGVPLAHAASTSLYSCPPHSGPELPHPDRVAGPRPPCGPGNSVGKISRGRACDQHHDEVEGPVFESEDGDEMEEEDEDGPVGRGAPAKELLRAVRVHLQMQRQLADQLKVGMELQDMLTKHSLHITGLLKMSGEDCDVSMECT